ncbi:MAG: hypothetical protein AB9915_02755 [Candidatus Dojkabacteria bacterium]
MNKILALIILVLLVLLIFSFGTETKEESVPWDKITVSETAEDSPYLGGYVFERCRNKSCWEETDKWSSKLELLFEQNKTVCFAFFSSGALFQSNEYHWVEAKKDGRNCVRFEKK